MDQQYYNNGWFEAKPNGECIDFFFHNIQADGPFDLRWVFEDHILVVLNEIGSIPDTFSVIPATGWQVVSETIIKVAEWATGVIQVCPILMG